jgi:hypothetical protein
MLDDAMGQNRVPGLALVSIALSIATSACLDLGLHKNAALEDVPGDYVAARFGEKRVLSIKKDGTYILRRSKDGRQDSYLGFWKGSDEGDYVQLDLQGAKDPKTDPFEWGTGVSELSDDLKHKVEKASGVQSGLPLGTVLRMAFVEKRLTGTVVISESFDEGATYEKVP